MSLCVLYYTSTSDLRHPTHVVAAGVVVMLLKGNITASAEKLAVKHSNSLTIMVTFALELCWCCILLAWIFLFCFVLFWVACFMWLWCAVVCCFIHLRLQFVLLLSTILPACVFLVVFSFVWFALGCFCLVSSCLIHACIRSWNRWNCIRNGTWLFKIHIFNYVSKSCWTTNYTVTNKKHI